MIKRWIIVLVLLTLGISGYSWFSMFIYPEIKHNSRISHLEREEKNIQALMNSISTKFEDVISWVYLYDYTYRAKIASIAPIDDSELGLQPTDNPFYQKLLLYHNANECYLISLEDIDQEDIDKDTAIYNLLSSNYQMTSHNIFYISCPIFVENKLFGYVSAVLEHDDTGVVIKQNFIRMITYQLGAYITSI